LRGRDGKGDLTNAQHKPIWNYHNEFPLYREYILINFFLNHQNEKKVTEKKTLERKKSLDFQSINETIHKINVLGYN
jgi:hypothetical protein